MNKNRLKNQDKIIWAIRKECLVATLKFWSRFLVVVTFSGLFFFLYSISPSSGIRNYSLFFCSLFLTFIPLVFPYPLLSRKTHRKLKNIFLILFGLLLLIQIILILFIEDFIKIYSGASLVIPLLTLIIIPNLFPFLKILVITLFSKVKIFAPDRAKVLSRFYESGIHRDYYYQPSKKMLEKGLPVLVVNNMKESIAITNVQIELIHRPTLVPLPSMKRLAILGSNRYRWSYLQYEYPLEESQIVDSHKARIFYIPLSELDAFDKLVKNNGEAFSALIHPMYITLVDSFHGEEWFSEKLFYPAFFMYFWSRD